MIGCSPEDGFCEKRSFSGSDGFDCSSMDNYFSNTGNGILEHYRSKKAAFSATYLLNKDGVANSDSAIIEKPEYMPSAIEIEKMSKCSIAPSVGGIDCDQWYSFTFITAENDRITFSSRNGDKISENLTLKYVFFEKSGLSLAGSASSSEISFYDETAIDGTIYKTKHIYLMIER